MAYRKYVIVFALLVQGIALKAQNISTVAADSTSYALYKTGEWQKLIEYGNTAIAGGADFVILRERIAYACFVTEDYKGALEQYNHVLASDSFNSIAHYYAYYCNVYLNNDPAAAVHASYIDSLTLDKEGIKKSKLTSVGVETGVKFPQNSARGGGFYSRVGLGNRIGWRFQLDQSVAYFNQNIYVPVTTTTTTPFNAATQTTNDDSQFEYYLKGRYSLSSKFSVLGSYHYLNTSYANNTYNRHLGLLGISYTGGRYVDVQADVNLGSLFSSHLTQVNAQFTFYPNGNLNLYTISRASAKDYNSQSQFVFSQSVGFKIARKLWFEGNGTFGNLDNYVEADGLYIYNAIDVTKLKAGATFFYQLNLHAMLQINYTYETKYDIYSVANYAQHSLNTGIVWKF